MREILLVEDSKDDRDLFQLALTRGGIPARLTYSVDAPDTIMRLNRMGRYKDSPMPDLIVLDLGLPLYKGSTLLDMIRRSIVSKRVAVVVWTGSTLESDRAICDSLGIQGYFTKPKTFDALVAFIGTLPRFFPTPAPLEPRRAGYQSPTREKA